MSSAKIIFYLLLIGCVGAFTANHYNAKRRGPFIAEIMDKAARYDNEGIAAEIDWEKLRAFMKADLIERASKTNPMNRDRMRGAHLRPDHIKKVVDYYIQPQNIILLFKLKKGYAPYYYESDFIGSIKSHNLTGIEVIFQHPERESVNPVLGHTQVKAIFQINQDLEWKMTELHIPLYFVPEYIPSADKEDDTIEKLNDKGLLRQPKATP